MSPVCGPIAHRSSQNEHWRSVRCRPHRGEFAALADDPAAGHPDAAVVDHAALTEELIATLQRTLTPMLDAIRPLAPFGRRGLWGLAADSAGGAALAVARETGVDHRRHWAEVAGILDRLAARGCPVHRRPRPLVARYRGLQYPFSIRGTCCLRYKEPAADSHADPDFPPGYCHSCPLVDDLVLERHYAAAARQRVADLSAGG